MGNHKTSIQCPVTICFGIILVEAETTMVMMVIQGMVMMVIQGMRTTVRALRNLTTLDLVVAVMVVMVVMVVMAVMVVMVVMVVAALVLNGTSPGTVEQTARYSGGGLVSRGIVT